MSDPSTPPPGEPGAPPPADDDEDGQTRAAFLPIGIVFLVLGIGGLLNDSMRSSAVAFLPVGFVFLVLGLQGRRGDVGDDEPTVGTDDAGPDVMPR